MNSPRPVNNPSRREFLRTSATAVAGSEVVWGLPAVLRGAADDRELRLGLVGCGGRGTGAAVQALAADARTTITALGDAFPEPLKRSLQLLGESKEYGSRVKVAAEHQFVGLDAYQKVIDSGVDVVLLTTPPAFRPQHLDAAVRAGKHVFWEWENGTRASIAQRQVAGCDNDATIWVLGNQGRAEFNMFGRGPVIHGANPWRLGNVKQEGHQLEHQHLFQAIRRGQAVNDGVRMAHSTLAAIMGRMAAYTGRQVTWEMALNSQEKVVPDALSWDMQLPLTPQAVPGLTKFV